MWDIEDLRRRCLGQAAPAEGEDPDETDDATLLEIEAAAVALVELQTNRYYGPVAAIVERFDGLNRARLHLRAPVSSLTSVHVAYGYGPLAQPWALSAFSYADGLELLDGSVFPRGRRSIKVTYQGGYAEGEEPAEIREAVMLIVSKTFNSRVTAVESESSEGANRGVTAALVVPKLAAEIIAAHRRLPGT